jgi:guanylate kinase
MREGEREGVQYFFCDEEKVEQLLQQGKIVELRAYQTVCGVWKYFTVDDGQVDFSGGQDYLIIGTLESYLKIREYYGKENVVPIYIEVEDGVRLSRALERERQQKHPGYEEMCRRFLADAIDFSEENLKKAEINVRFSNDSLKETFENIRHYIKEGDGLWISK